MASLKTANMRTKRAALQAQRTAMLQGMLARLHVPMPYTEFKFHPTRLWRFDYAWPLAKVAVEVEGGVWTMGRHTRGAGFENDIEKYNAAGEMGWIVLRYTPETIATPSTARQIAATLANRVQS